MDLRKQTPRIAAVLFACFAGALAAHAGETLVGEVPFDFTMGDKTFPAGEYQFQVDQFAAGTVRVRSTDFSTAAIALSRKAGGAMSGGGAIVKFNVYGGQRFLSMIQTSKGTAVTLGRGGQERSLAKAQSAPSVALVRPSSVRKANS